MRVVAIATLREGTKVVGFRLLDVDRRVVSDYSIEDMIYGLIRD